MRNAEVWESITDHARSVHVRHKGKRATVTIDVTGKVIFMRK